MPKNKSWYQIRNAANGVGEISIYDDIGIFGIDARMFRDELSALGDVQTLNVRIQSEGGDVFDGISIHNMLARHPAKVIVTVDSLAASIASVIAMAGDEIVMPANSFLFVHDPSGAVIGTAEDMRETADALDKIKNALISAYRRNGKANLDDDAIFQMMAANTWLSADEAVALGLADRIAEPVKMAAKFDLRRFSNPPESIRNQGAIMPPENNTLATEPKAPQVPAVEAAVTDPVTPEVPAAEPVEGETPEAPQAPDAVEPQAPAVDPAVQARLDAVSILNACIQAGLSNLAAGYIEQGLSLDDVKAKIANSGKIKDLCLAAKLPARAENYIKAGLSADEVKAQLFDVLVNMDSKTAIDNSIVPQVVVSEAQKAAEKLNPTNIYANRTR